MYKLSALLIAATLLLSTTLFSQKKLTLSASVGSGTSFFRGSGTTESSDYYTGGTWPFDFHTMIEPYGKNSLANFVAGLQLDFRNKPTSKWVWSLNVQYEHSGATLAGDSVFSTAGDFKTEGKYKRYYDYISFNPQVGRILCEKAVSLTVHAGFDYTSKLDQGEEFDYIDPSGQQYSIGGSGGEPEVNDMRITCGATLTRKKWSLNVNYKHGIVDYDEKGPGKVYSRLLHIRVMFALFSKNF